MSTTANPLSFFKQPVQRYYDELPHSITQAVVGGAAISFAITALGYNNPSVGLIASAASMALTLVDAALRPFFNRYLPYSPDGLLNLANHAIRVIIVGAIVSAAAAAAAPIIGTAITINLPALACFSVFWGLFARDPYSHQHLASGYITWI